MSPKSIRAGLRISFMVFNQPAPEIMHKIGAIAAAALVGGMFSTNAFAAGHGGGGVGGRIGGFTGGGRAVAGRAHVTAGSPRPFLTLRPNGRPFSVPLFAISPNVSTVYPQNLQQSQTPPTNPQGQNAAPPSNYYYGSYPGPSESGQGATSGAYVSVAGATGTKIAETCGNLANDMTNIPVDQVRKAIHPTSDQQAELDQLKAASSEAKKLVEAACAVSPSGLLA